MGPRSLPNSRRCRPLSRSQTMIVESSSHPPEARVRPSDEKARHTAGPGPRNVRVTRPAARSHRTIRPSRSVVTARVCPSGEYATMRGPSKGTESLRTSAPDCSSYRATLSPTQCKPGTGHPVRGTPIGHNPLSSETARSSTLSAHPAPPRPPRDPSSRSWCRQRRSRTNWRDDQAHPAPVSDGKPPCAGPGPKTRTMRPISP